MKQNNWFSDKVQTSGEVVEVKSRHDGKYNVWRKRVSTSKEEGIFSFWEVVEVCDTLQSANRAKAAL